VQLDLLVILRIGLSQRQVFGQQDGHGLGQKPRAGVVGDQLRPLLRTIARLFDQLAPAAGQQLLSGLNAARGQLQQDLIRSMAILPDEQDTGVFRVLRRIHRQNHDRAVVSDNVARRRYAARLLHRIARHPEHFALVDLLRREGLAATLQLHRFLFRSHIRTVTATLLHHRPFRSIQVVAPAIHHLDRMRD